MRACEKEGAFFFQQSDYSLSVLVAHPIGAQRRDWQSGILARNPFVRPWRAVRLAGVRLMPRDLTALIRINNRVLFDPHTVGDVVLERVRNEGGWLF